MKNHPRRRTWKPVVNNAGIPLLVVEDSLEMRLFVTKQLSSEYQVLTAVNGIEALKVLGEHTVNLVISDIMMPEMDGLELCEHLKSELDYSHIPHYIIDS